jgi:hypothetical protein
MLLHFLCGISNRPSKGQYEHNVENENDHLHDLNINVAILCSKINDDNTCCHHNTNGYEQYSHHFDIGRSFAFLFLNRRL